MQQPEDSDDWITPDTRISFTLSGESDLSQNGIAILLGAIDVSALFQQRPNGEFQYRGAMDLPSGVQRLQVFKVDGNRWSEIGQTTLRVLTPPGFESTALQPRLNFSVDSLVVEGHSEDAEAPENPHYTNLSMSAGLSYEGRRGDTSVQSNINLVGSSDREQALRYSERGEDAAKVDMSDYLVAVNKGNGRFTLGHSSFGQNPLLISSISNRGVTFRQQLSDNFDFSIASQNGTDIVGYNNLFGLQSFDHNISGGTLGYELFSSRPGGLRVELSYVAAKIQSDTNFDVGEITEAEESEGYGIRLLGSSKSGRLRGELNYAQSSYSNSQDKTLNQGIEDLVADKESTDSAYRINLNYDILDNDIIDDSFPVSLTVSLLHERIDPLYKTLVAFPNADMLMNQVEFVSLLDSLSIQLQYSWMEDNLDDLASVLKTKTRTTVLSASYDFSQLFESESISGYIPEASLVLNRVHQYAANNPEAEISDFNGSSHLPNQSDLSGDLELSWSLDHWELGYIYSYSNQDNRQSGRERDDFKTNEHSLEAEFQLTERFLFGVAMGRVKNVSLSEALVTYSNSVGFNFNWRSPGEWGIAGAFDKTFEDDSKGLVEADAVNADLRVASDFDLNILGGGKRHGQLYLRYNMSEDDSIDNEFEIESLVKTWTISAGLNLSVF